MRLLPATASPLDDDPRHRDVAAHRACASGAQSRRRDDAALETTVPEVGTLPPDAGGNLSRKVPGWGNRETCGAGPRTPGRAGLRNIERTGTRRHGHCLPGP